MKKSKLISLLVFLLVVPATLILGSQMKGRWYYLTSTLVILETMLPFFLVFEGRKPQARELILIAVLCAMGMAGRMAFMMLPNFKAVSAAPMVMSTATTVSPFWIK